MSALAISWKLPREIKVINKLSLFLVKVRSRAALFYPH
nr:MAG TPA: hypothetical protein [Caudoviricetes sp.]